MSLAALLVPVALAQCSGPTSIFQNNASLKGWPSGATVYVYFVTDDNGHGWTGEQDNFCGAAAAGDACASGGFYNWNLSIDSGGVGSGLTLIYGGVDDEPGTMPTHYLTVTYGDPMDYGCGDDADACTQDDNNNNVGTVVWAQTMVSTDLEGEAYLDLAVHEVGHSYGAEDCDGCNDTTMIEDGNPYAYPTCCDAEWAYDSGSGYGIQYCYDDTCDGTDPCLADENCDADDPTCDAGCCVATGGGGGGGGGEGCQENDESCVDDSDCCSGFCDDGYCEDEDPIIIDLTGRGYQLTSAENGVYFDFFGDGKPILISWTAADWEGGFLALDRNGNGKIDDGTELFTNITPQPETRGNGNGFLALAAYDQPENGGNGDGLIDKQDAVFSKLLVWVDKNHNGVSDPGELLTMAQAGITAISLKYSKAGWKDAYGNTFEFGAPIEFSGLSGQMVYDVILQQAKQTEAK